MTYKVKDNETIWSVANKLYGLVSYAYKLARDNGFELNDDITGRIIEYDDSIFSSVSEPLIIEAVVSQNVSQIYYSLSNQTIFDVALQTLGGLENIVDLVKNSTLEYMNSDTEKQRFVFVDTKNSIRKYISLTGRVFGNKPTPQQDQLREHDDSFVRTSYT
jgi:hypothetical protein